MGLRVSRATNQRREITPAFVPMTVGVLDNGWRERETATTMWMGEWIDGIAKADFGLWLRSKK